MVNQLGLLPIALIFSPYLYSPRLSFHAFPFLRDFVTTGRGLTDVAYVLGVLLLYARTVEMEGSSLMRNFLRNGATEPWGCHLYLSGLKPVECDRALFAGLWQREVRSLGVRFAFLLLIIGPIAYSWAVGISSLGSFAPFPCAPPTLHTTLGVFRFGVVVCGAAWIELAMISALNLALELREAARVMAPRKLGIPLGVPNFLVRPAVLIVAHLPGLFVYHLRTLYLIHAGYPTEAFSFGLSDMVGMYLFILANVPLVFYLARRLLERYEGNVGTAMGRLIQEQASA